jgi:hypothetical protein
MQGFVPVVCPQEMKSERSLCRFSAIFLSKKLRTSRQMAFPRVFRFPRVPILSRFHNRVPHFSAHVGFIGNLGNMVFFQYIDID